MHLLDILAAPHPFGFLIAQVGVKVYVDALDLTAENSRRGNVKAEGLEGYRNLLQAVKVLTQSKLLLLAVEVVVTGGKQLKSRH